MRGKVYLLSATPIYKGADIMIYGYHRTSTKEQHLDRGIAEIENFCKKNDLKLEKIFTDQQTGKNFDRPRYTVLRNDVLRAGDTLIIAELDRLGRNKESTIKELRFLKEHGIRVMILEIPTTLQDLSGMDDTTASLILETINNILIEVFTTFAQSEMQKRVKRQQEGIEQMKARGEWSKYGRPAAMSFDTFRERYEAVENGEVKPFDLMRELGLTKSTFYRYKKQYEENK